MVVNIDDAEVGVLLVDDRAEVLAVVLSVVVGGDDDNEWMMKQAALFMSAAC